jgi:hypothetical protein
LTTGPAGAGEQHGPAEHPEHSEVGQSQGHENSRCRSAWLPRSQIPNLPSLVQEKHQVSGNDRFLPQALVSPIAICRGIQCGRAAMIRRFTLLVLMGYRTIPVGR